MNRSDINWALHQIEQMVIVARRSTQGLKPSNDPAYRLVARSTSNRAFSHSLDPQRTSRHCTMNVLDRQPARLDQLL
jgi:hypothetical protein